MTESSPQISLLFTMRHPCDLPYTAWTSDFCLNPHFLRTALDVSEWQTQMSVPLWSISRPKAMLCWTVQFCSIAGLWHLYLLSCFLSCICVFSFGRKLNLETTESAETRQQIVLIRNYHKLCKQCFSHREIQQYGANKSINLFMNWLKEEEKNIAFLFTDSNKPFPAGYRFYKKYLYIYR